MSGDGFGESALAFLHWVGALESQKSGTHLGFASPTHAGAVKFIAGGQTIARPALVAARDVSAGEILITIAARDILSIKTSTLHNHISRKELDLLPAWLVLVLALLYELGLGAESQWWPYLNMLPSNFDTLMHWNNDELQELKGSHILNRIGKAEAEETFKDLLFPIATQYSSIFGSLRQVFSDPGDPNLGIKIAHRLATLVSMNGVDFEDDDDQEDADSAADEDGLVEDRIIKGMMPLVDLIRADPVEPNVQLRYNDDGAVSFVSLKPIANGDELIQSPGDIPNSELLRCYGIITNQDNPFDVAEVDLDTLSGIAKAQGRSSSQINKRQTLAERWDVLDDGYDLLRSPSSNGINPELLLISGLLTTVSDDTVRELKDSQKRPKAQLERGNATLILDACERRQKMYPTTLAEDIAILGHNLLPLRKSMAVRVRLGEKQVLADNIAYLRSFLVDGGEIEEVDSRDAKRQKT